MESVEVWSAADPEQGSCVLNDYPREMMESPEVNLVSSHLVACYRDSCDVYHGCGHHGHHGCGHHGHHGSWQHLQNTRATRRYHSSATTEDAILLIGGIDSRTTEWIPLDGSPAQEGPFTVRHGWEHCTIQLSDDVIVVTGGSPLTEDLVTQYHLSDGTETPLTSMGQQRSGHACGAYQDIGGQQVSKSI